VDIFIEDSDFPLPRCQRRERQQTQRLPDSVAIPSTTFEVREADEWVAGVDQV